MGCHSARQLESLLASLGGFNEVNVSTAIARLGRTKSKNPAAIARVVALSRGMDFTPRHLSNICHGIASGRLLPALPEHVVGQIQTKLDEFEPQGLSNVLWSLATLQARDQHELALGVLNSLAKTSHKLNCQDVANSIWAMASLNCFHAPALQRLTGEKDFLPNLSECTPQNLCNIAWAFALLHGGHAKLNLPMRELAQAISNKIHLFRTNDLSIAIWAFAGMDSTLICHAIELEVAKRDPRTFPPQSVSGILAGMAKLNHPSEVWSRLVNTTAVLERKLAEWPPQDIANLLSATATLKLPAAELFRIASALPLIRFNPQDLAQLAWSFATVGDVEPALFTAIAARVVGNASKFAPQDLSMLVWAFASVESGNCSVSRKMVDEIGVEVIRRNKQAFSPQSLAMLVWGLASMRNANTVLVFQAVAGEVVKSRNLADFGDKDVTMLLWAFAQADFKDEAMLGAVWNHLKTRQLPQCTMGFLTNVLWTSAVLNYGDRALVDLVAKELARRGSGGGDNQTMCTALWSLACLDVLELESVKQVFDLPAVAPSEPNAVGAGQLFFARLAWQQVHGAGSRRPRALEHAPSSVAAANPEFHQSSKTHLHVSRVLQRLGEQVENEAIVLDGVVVDIYLSKRNLVIEVDGPFHSFVNRGGGEKTGRTLFKHRLLTRAGFTVHSISALEFEQLSNKQQLERMRAVLLA